MTAVDDQLTTTVEHRFAAPPERVFDAWLDPEMLARFMKPAPETTVPRAECEARVGGRFEIVMALDGKELPHAGTYQTIDRPSRLVFTWESPFSEPGSTVTLTFRPEGTGTHVTLRHERFASEESRDNHQRGWAAILETLDGQL